MSISRLGVKVPDGVKPPIVVETDGPITLFGEQTIMTVDVVNNDRVLVKDQPDPADNGIYNCKVAAAWERAADFNKREDVANGVLIVSQASGLIWQVQVSGIWYPNLTPVNFSIIIDPLPADDSAIWGNITGTLADQIDLQSALDGKVDNSQVQTNVPAGAVFTDTTYSQFTNVAEGLVPASGGGSINFLRADGTWSAPAGGGGGNANVTQSIQYARAYGK